MELLPLSIGIGLVVSLMFSEVFGLAAGGMVVPGYIALYLTHPLPVVLTLSAGFATFLIVRALSSVAIIYGKRRTVLMILFGYLLGALLQKVAIAQLGPDIVPHPEHLVIGHIIPGLIAIWLDRQGVVETFSALVTAAVIVRLVLIVFVGTGLSL